MNKALQKKLLSYSALATAFLAVEKPADAQIVYHQVDTTLGMIDTTQYYFLDLNGDGIYDFSLSCFQYRTDATFKTPSSSSTKTFSYIKANGEVNAYNSNKLNKSLRLQSTIAKASSVNSSFESITLNKSNFYKSGYMPLKLISNGHTYMGWVRLNLTKGYGGGLEIISYAYELNPSNSIVLGDSGCNHYSPTPVITLHGTDTLVSTPSTKYQWYLNGALANGDTTQSLVNPPHGYYSVITTDTGGCKTQSTAVNFSVCGSSGSNLLINTYEDYGNCSSMNISTQLNYIPPYQFDSVSWYINGQLFDTTANPLYSFSKTIKATSGFYAVAYNQFMQCYDTSNTVYDTIFPPPTMPVITQHGDTLVATDSVKQVYYYTWHDNNNGFYKGTGDINYYIPDSSGIYTVIISNENGCDSTSLPYQYTDAGIDMLSSTDIIKVYTNDDNIYINFSNDDYLNGTIELYNIEGQKLQGQNIASATEKLNTQQYAKGIYFVSITKNGVRKVYKVALL